MPTGKLHFSWTTPASCWFLANVYFCTQKQATKCSFCNAFHVPLYNEENLHVTTKLQNTSWNTYMSLEFSLQLIQPTTWGLDGTQLLVNVPHLLLVVCLQDTSQHCDLESPVRAVRNVGRNNVLCPVLILQLPFLNMTQEVTSLSRISYGTPPDVRRSDITLSIQKKYIQRNSL